MAKSGNVAETTMTPEENNLPSPFSKIQYDQEGKYLGNTLALNKQPTYDTHTDFRTPKHLEGLCGNISLNKIIQNAISVRLWNAIVRSAMKYALRTTLATEKKPENRTTRQQMYRGIHEYFCRGGKNQYGDAIRGVQETRNTIMDTKNGKWLKRNEYKPLNKIAA